jgi:hypothetical protein
MKATLQISDFRAALRSVGPHLLDDDDLPMLRRIRVALDGENATLSATNRYTVARAIVSDWEPDGEAGHVDISPEQVGDVLRLFKTSRDGGDEQYLSIEFDDEQVTVTDVSGMFAGKVLKFPRLQDELVPDLGHMITGVMNRNLEDREPTPRLVINWDKLKLFGAASSAYGQPLVFDVASEVGAILVTCGESFIGALMPIRQDDETTGKLASWHAAWVRRLQRERELATLAGDS